MEMNKSFWTGLGCGICIGASMLTLRKIYNTGVVLRKFSPTSGCKLVFVVRTDLNMTKGKIAAQCSHAAVGAYKAAQEHQPTILDHWLSSGQPKIALRADSERELLRIKEKAKSLGIITSLIKDDGRTQIPRGSVTVLESVQVSVLLVLAVVQNMLHLREEL
ncbi:peptidyl-tRNA hydrolase PTH2 domain-containing protein [Phthorimaea operculella]|nr:peptidyl-tRNA hydrolase PTH2 domain-containing protein [Phthorimaea operculella]